MKNEKQSLAIVIPAYKSTYLSETIESIANQTDKRFTLYIGDDCSPYDLQAIVGRFENRIRLIYHRFEENLGGKDLVAQWERCIELTEGEPYIWLFSDDDTMNPDCVASFYSLPEEIRSNSLLHFNINMIDEFDRGQIKPLAPFPNRMTAGEYLKAKLEGKIVSYVVEFIFSRTLYNDVGGFQNFNLAWGSDFITWLKMAAISKYGIITIPGDNNLIKWRKSNENITPDKSYPVQIRKISSLIENAAFIRHELIESPGMYYPLKVNFKWLRFPLGEIKRNLRILSIKDRFKLCRKYSSVVGYSIYTWAFFLFTLFRKRDN